VCVSVPAHVEAVRAGEATVEIAGTRRTVSLEVLALLGVHVAVGDWLIVNAGLALERIEPREAEEFVSLFGDALADAQEESP